MSKVGIWPFTGQDPVTLLAVFVRESDRKIYIALTDSDSKLYCSLCNENRGVRLAVAAGIETLNYDQDGALRVAKLLETMLPEIAADGWLEMTVDEAVAHIQQAAAVLGVALEQPRRSHWTWLI